MLLFLRNGRTFYHISTVESSSQYIKLFISKIILRLPSQRLLLSSQCKDP